MPFKKIRKSKHRHATYNIIPRRPSDLEGKSVVLKHPMHSLTAYNLLFKYTRSKIFHSTSITNNDVVAAFPSPQKFFDTLNLPRNDRTDKKKKLNIKTHGKITFHNLAIKVAAKCRLLSPEKKNIYPELTKQDKERYYREKEHFFPQIEEGNKNLQRNHICDTIYL